MLLLLILSLSNKHHSTQHSPTSKSTNNRHSTSFCTNFPQWIISIENNTIHWLIFPPLYTLYS